MRPKSGKLAAPLLPVALAVTAGIAIERTMPLPSPMLVSILVALTAGRLLAQRRQARLLAVVLLWCIAGTLGACWHRVCHAWPGDAVGHHALFDRVPVTVRGVIVEDVEYHLPRRPELLSGQGTLGYSLFLLDVHSLKLTDGWQRVSGRVRVTVEGELAHLQVGDGVEAIGSLLAFLPVVNPGGIDFRQRWLDQQVQASFAVKTIDGIREHPESARQSIASWMARARSWVRRSLSEHLPQRQAGIAQALLCGEQTALSPDQFESYLHTGVYHVLAVSGQHLAILGAFVGFLLRFTGLDLRKRTIWLAIFVLAYTLLTGARPPVVRAAIIVMAWCPALWLRRKISPLNILSAAWLTVALLHPADLANTGCQLSFLAVLVLLQLISPWYGWSRRNVPPLDRLEAEYRPLWLKAWHAMMGGLKWAMLTSLVVWLCTVPLILSQFHLFSPVAVLLGPLLIMPITVALIGGMLLVLLQGVPVAASTLAWTTMQSLRLSDALVETGRDLPWSFGYWPDVPGWWVAGFYLILVGVLLYPSLHRHWKAASILLAGWLAAALLLVQPDVPNGLRTTVLSVGHGIAIVVETPGGKCLVYDAGSLAGPDVALRHLSHYLWHRGRSRIDEVLLSHADLDHFNALPELLKRFRVGRVRTNPTFDQKRGSGMDAALAEMQARKIERSILQRGDVLHDGEVRIEVLHPPLAGISGTENARSLVLLITYQDACLLLTGDLEHEGLEQVMAMQLPPIDVLVAPHHGSRVSNTERFADWCRPRLAISSETYPRGPKPDPYSPLGGVLWRTWIHGGVTVRIADGEVSAQTHLTKLRWP